MQSGGNRMARTPNRKQWCLRWWSLSFQLFSSSCPNLGRSTTWNCSLIQWDLPISQCCPKTSLGQRQRYDGPPIKNFNPPMHLPPCWQGFGLHGDGSVTNEKRSKRRNVGLETKESRVKSSSCPQSNLAFLTVGKCGIKPAGQWLVELIIPVCKVA